MIYRSFNKLLRESLKQIKYIPLIYRTFANWFVFLLSHLRIKQNESFFRFRNGLVIKVDRENDDGWSPSVLMDIFIKKEYGVIPDNITLIDIGANIGAFSVYATHNLNNLCYSFEPMYKNFDILVDNIKNNKLHSKIKAFKMAVSSVCSDQKLYTSISMSHSLHVPTDTYEIVKTINLEIILLENKLKKIDIAKIDCEGGEYDIIYSSPKEILLRIDKYLIEYHNMSEPYYNGNELIKYFKDYLGYEIYSNRLNTDKLGIFMARKL